MSSKMQYVNNDILTDCVLAKGFKELRISCGDMRCVPTQGSILDVFFLSKRHALPNSPAWHQRATPCDP